MGMTVRDLIDQRAATYGQKTYFISPDTEEEISYAELNMRINRTANLLLEAGVTKGDKIGILLANTPEFLYVYFAAMKIGAVAGPINILLKGEEIAYILNNSEAKILVFDDDFLTIVNDIRDQVPLIKRFFVVGEPNDQYSSLEAEINTQSEELVSFDLHPDDEAMIIYTSGTTGHPKGVLLSHRNLVTDAQNIANWHQFTPEDRAMCILPLFHVNGEVVTVITPLYYGGSVVMPRRFSASRFWPTIAKYRVNWFSAVPTNLTILLNTPISLEDYDLSSLRFAICGAAPLPVEVQRNFERRFGIYIIEGYGLSETTCYSSFNRHPPKGEEALGEGNEYRRFGSIGLAVGNEMRIVDNKGDELPVGERGEIVIRGANVMKGYYKRPEANAEAFRNGWFHTGDVGYRDEDGYFYITDRKKDMIIRGGENIYPREIDEVLYQHPKVRDAATVGIPDEKYGEEVRSFIVLKENEAASAEELIAYCHKRLAAYKCPREVIFVEEIPKGPSGKLLRRKLIEMYS